MAIQRRRPDVELTRRRRRRRTSVTPNADVTPDLTPGRRPGGTRPRPVTPGTPASPARRRGFLGRIADRLRRTGRRLQGNGNNG